MTKSTLKTFWLTGGGLVATWLAVTPNPTAPVGSRAVDGARAATARQVTIADLVVEDATRHAQGGATTLRPSSRNPFRFGRSVTRPATQPVPVPTVPAASMLLLPSEPALSLSGIATEGAVLTAIISSSDGQLYLVKEGEPVAGHYHVARVEHDAVTLTDDAGNGETRLPLK